MDTTRNPGFLAVLGGVGLAVLFVLLGITRVLEGQIAYGMATILVVVAALLYIFYMRGTAVTKTGYAALVFILGLGLIIPAFLVNQQQAQATAQAAQYDQTLHRAAALFGQYCSTCHGYQGLGKIGPRLNNNPVVNSLQDDDIRRIISAGVPNTQNLAQLLMPAWSQAYGGPLSEDDIAYLIALIRSSSPDYRATKSLGSVNGFDYVYATLTNATQQAQFNADKSGSAKPAADQFLDATAQKAVTIDSINTPTGAVQWGWQVKGGQTPNVIISVGTTVTWTNISNAPHNVESGPSGQPDNKFKSPGILAANSTDTYSFTFDKAGEYPYFCGLHPAMIGWITVK